MKLNAKIHEKLLTFIKFAVKEVGLYHTPKILFTDTKEDSIHAFGHFNPNTKAIHVRITGRHILDVMRTIAHEIVHYKQLIHGGIGDVEDHANAIAGRIMRKYNNMHPELFKQSPIKEDTASVIPANAVGDASAPNAAFPALGNNPPGKKKSKTSTTILRLTRGNPVNGR